MKSSRDAKNEADDRKPRAELRLYVPDGLSSRPSDEADAPGPRLPVVLPAPETVGPFERGRLRKVLAGGAVVVVLCVAAFFLLRSGEGERGEAGAGLGLGTRDAAAAPAGTSPGADGSGTAPASPADSAARLFDRRSDSLAAALDRYAVRSRDFGSDVIGCEELAMGYRRADSTFVALSELVGSAGTALDSTRMERYRDLAGRASGVDRAFGATKCPRPR